MSLKMSLRFFFAFFCLLFHIQAKLVHGRAALVPAAGFEPPCNQFWNKNIKWYRFRKKHVMHWDGEGREKQNDDTLSMKETEGRREQCWRVVERIRQESGEDNVDDEA